MPVDVQKLLNDPDLYAKFIIKFAPHLHCEPLFLFLVPEYCRATLVETFKTHGIDSSLSYQSPAYSEVPEYLSAGDIALYFLPYSSPRVGIKFVEYCSIGLPTIVNMNVNGASELVSKHGLGFSLKNILSDPNAKPSRAKSR
jgi:hypothetical protein